MIELKNCQIGIKQQSLTQVSFPAYWYFMFMFKQLFHVICVCLHVVVFNTYCVVLYFVLCTLCCQFLWIVHFWLPLRYCPFLIASTVFSNSYFTIIIDGSLYFKIILINFYPKLFSLHKINRQTSPNSQS
jgi:hypothetical protein